VSNKPLDVLDEFLWNLKIENYDAASKCVQLSFKSKYSKLQLIHWLESCIPFRMQSYKINGLYKRTDGLDESVFKTFDVDVTDYSNRVYKCYPNVICEDRPYRASVDGTWGVNPISSIPKDMYSDDKHDKNKKRNLKRLKNLL